MYLHNIPICKYLVFFLLRNGFTSNLLYLILVEDEINSSILQVVYADLLFLSTYRVSAIELESSA